MASGERAKAAQKAARGRGSGLRRLGRVVLRLAVVLVLIPVVLVPVYSFVPPVSTLMVADWLRLRPVDRRWVPLSEISENAVAAVVMSEDGKFCAHYGVDWDVLFTVIDKAAEGERTRGASTISMQTVKNLFLWSSRSYLRKALEIPLALYADLIWPKARMIEIYLNVAEFGPGIYGIEAAAQRYYGRSASKLSRRQAARLAAALPDPLTRNPKSAGRATGGIARIIEKRMTGAGAYIACIGKG
ncbi:MAG: monofunctional biosynthetic peptidoglycan transglycosylase [Hyphomicrobiales bacterium]|nr:monofunctional biosynthetic peptidoglycan transglycosylase [Hyphomicrobiales bacterium]